MYTKILIFLFPFMLNAQIFFKPAYLQTDFKVTDTLLGVGIDDYVWSAGFIDINPVTNKLTHIHQRGSSHWGTSDCQDIMIRQSQGYWNNLSTDDYLLSYPNVQYTELGGGYLRDGRGILLYSKRTCPGGIHVGLYSQYSDDDFVTLSDSSFMDTTLYTNGFKCNIMPQKLIELSNGDVIWYGSSFTEDHIYGTIVGWRSTDHGANFDSVNIVFEFTVAVDYFPVEPTGLNFHDSVIVVFARDLNRGYFRQWTSTDFGITFRDDTISKLGETINSGVEYTHTGFLNKFYYKNSLIIENTFFNRSTNQLKVIYAHPDSLVANGLSGWDTSTKRTLNIDVGDGTDGYMYVYHIGRTPEAYGVIVDDQNSQFNADVKYYDMPTTHIDTIYNILYP